MKRRTIISPIPTAERVRELFSYNEETGELTRRFRVNPIGGGAGSLAGYRNGDGAVRISIDGGKYLVHRIIWLWKTGEWPTFYIDHRDLNRANNRWSNLRECDQSENTANTRARKTNKTGLKGVAKITKTGKYQVNITKDYKIRCVGIFDCPAAAHFAYIIAANETFGEFARAG